MAGLVSTVPATVLAIYAHPDDPDVSAGGTLATWAAAGASVDVCIGADGDKGTTDASVDPDLLVSLRRKEVAAAGGVVGVRRHHWLGWRDGEIADTADNRLALVALIRRVRPDVVVAPDPTAVFFGAGYVNHRDHRNLGWLVLDAVSPAAGLPHYFPDAGAPHRVSSLMLSGTLAPDAWVDVTEAISVKAAAVACHQSQVGEPGAWLDELVRERAEDAGRQAGVRYAEAFRRMILT